MRVVLPSSEIVTPQVTPQDNPQDNPQDTEQDTPQDTPQVKELLSVFTGQHSRKELQDLLGLTNRKYIRLNYLQPAIQAGYVALLYPDKPTSRNQRYYLTSEGKAALKKWSED